jgi:hypothetical protein
MPPQPEKIAVHQVLVFITPLRVLVGFLEPIR